MDPENSLHSDWDALWSVRDSHEPPGSGLESYAHLLDSLVTVEPCCVDSLELAETSIEIRDGSLGDNFHDELLGI